MLENIKLILGLNKTDYDDLIIFYIDKVTKRVKGYCNIEDFSELNQIDQDTEKKLGKYTQGLPGLF